VVNRLVRLWRFGSIALDLPSMRLSTRDSDATSEMSWEVLSMGWTPATLSWQTHAWIGWLDWRSAYAGPLVAALRSPSSRDCVKMVVKLVSVH